MIVYCTGTKKGDPAHQTLLKNIIDYTESLGHTVLAELSSRFTSSIPLTDNQVYKRNIKWIDGSKLVIAEISNNELETGIEIAYALFQSKIPVLVLHIADVQRISSMLTGFDSTLLKIEKYGDINEMHDIVKTYLVSQAKS